MGEDTSSAGTRRGKYGVRLVRGPFVQLPPNAEECRDEDGLLAYATELRDEGHRLAADLFSGAGGLSFGLEEAGYRVILGIDRDKEATETHRHHFGGLTLDWDLGKPEHIAQVAHLVKAAGIDLLAGGPPCQPFSRAGRSKIRHRVVNGFTDPSSERRDLWRSFLEVVTTAKPRAVLMENVPDMALDKDMFILRTMVHELESIGYAVEERVVDTSQYGVPQFRQRLILVALRDGVHFEWPAPLPDRVTVWNAIGDLPSVEGGWRPEGGAEGWAPYKEPPAGLNSFQLRMRRGMDGEFAERVYDQITRPVREDDKIAFAKMDAKTLYSDLPKELKRYRDDIFDDKYKRLDENDLSRTITAHIAKDGYWYIHPRDARTLTVREAARLQTFPDRYRFAGPPSAAFRQIGNAVPPLLGENLGIAIQANLEANKTAGSSTLETGKTLAEWFRSRPIGELTLPWLRALTRWQVIAGEVFAERLTAQQLRSIWPLIEGWEQPADTLAEEAKTLNEMARWLNRASRAERLLQIARRLADIPMALDGDQTIRQAFEINESLADLAVLAVPSSKDDDDAEEPVLVGRGVLRVAARFTGEDTLERKNRMTDGRLAVARMIGYGDKARDAQLALVELAASACRPESRACHICPLASTCVVGRAELNFDTTYDEERHKLF
jgi:DNA (cytosine-5)-methyltransferase 1